MKKLLIIATICVAIGALSIVIFVATLLIPVNPRQYSTSNVNDYGHYSGNKDNQFASEYIGAFFPEVIDERFTDVTYLYRAQNYANYAFEAYLEFVIEDEEIYKEFVHAKTSGLEGKTFSYDPSFVEYTLTDTLEIFILDSKGNENNKVEIRDAQIGKILCRAEDHRVIFVAMAMRDAWGAYTDFFCVFFNRFEIDPTKYEGAIIR